jgi:hypothetical protein
MQIRLWDRKADYPVFAQWWAAHNSPPVAEVLLPDCGLVAERNGNAIAAAWLYQDVTAPVGNLGFFVAKPLVLPQVVSYALRKIVGAAERVARENGILLLRSSVDVRGLQKLLARAGWVFNSRHIEFWKEVPRGV